MKLKQNIKKLFKMLKYNQIKKKVKNDTQKENYLLTRFRFQAHAKRRIIIRQRLNEIIDDFN